jgi:hypothetical protein
MLAVFLAVVSLGESVPAAPTNFFASVSETMSGTLPGIRNGTSTYNIYYNYAGKMLRHSDPATGKEVVYRYDKKVPGESWSRAYEWIVGKEATCCYIDLCNGGPPCSSGVEQMTQIAVAPKSVDKGPSTSGKGELWHKDGPNFRECFD